MAYDELLVHTPVTPRGIGAVVCARMRAQPRDAAPVVPIGHLAGRDVVAAVPGYRSAPLGVSWTADASPLA
jgi:hypothetical protein